MRAKWIAAAIVCGLALNVYGDDLIGKSTASETLKKMGAELAKKKGYHVLITPAVPAIGLATGGSDTPFKGIVRKPDFAALAGGTEAYCKGPYVVVRDGARFIEPDKIKGAENKVALLVKNPSIIYADAIRFGMRAVWKTAEQLEGVDCKMCETTADGASADKMIREHLKLVPPPKEQPSFDYMTIVDTKKSSVNYRVWVAKEDLLARRIEWEIKVVVDESRTMGYKFGRLGGGWRFDISKYDTDLSWEFPKEIKAKFGVKDEAP